MKSREKQIEELKVNKSNFLKELEITEKRGDYLSSMCEKIYKHPSVDGKKQ